MYRFAMMGCRAGTCCPLSRRKQTFTRDLRKSALCQQRTHAPQQTASLFNHFIGALSANTRKTALRRSLRNPLRCFISHLRHPNYCTKTANRNYFFLIMASRLKRPGPNALIARLIDSSPI